MLPKDLATYGGPHVDTKPQSDPRGQVAAAQYDRRDEDVAQLTRTPTKARVWFYTSAAAPPFDYAPADVTHESIWGTGSAQKPVVRKTATGRYTITYAATFTDPLGVVETVNFRTVGVQSILANPADDHDAKGLTVGANVATLKTESPRMTLADAGNVSAAPLLVVVELS